MVAQGKPRVTRRGRDEVRVLLVDDEPGFAETAGAFLEREKEALTVATETGAPDGLDRLRRGDVDAIVSDYDMPEMDGLAFLEAVRETHPDLPFVLFTGKGSEEIASDAVSAGVTDYLQKGTGTDQYALLGNRIVNAVERHRAEREIRATYQAIETAQEGISILEDGRFTYVNEAYADLYGYEPSDLVGEHFRALYPEEDLAEIEDEVLPTVRERGYWRGETRGKRKDGTTIVEDHVLSLTDDGRLVCAVRDITDRKEREQELEALSVAIDASMDGVAVLDEDEEYEFVNRAHADVYGYDDPEALVGRSWRHLYSDAEAARLAEEVMPALYERGHWRGEATGLRRDGSTFEQELSLSTIDDGGLVCIVRDVTERKAYERELEEHRAKITALHDIAVRMEGCTTEQAVCDLTVEAAQDILEFDICVVDVEEDGRLPTRAGVGLPSGGTETMSVEEGVAGKTYRTGESYLHEDVRDVPHAKPQDEYLSALSVPIGDRGVFQAGAHERAAFDETDLELAELLVSHTAEALDRVERERELEQYETMVETVADGVYALDAEGRYSFVNRTFEEVTGYDREAVVGQSADLLLDGTDVDRFEAAISEMLHGEREAAVFEMDVEAADGSTIPIEARIALLPTDDGEFRGTVGVARDISDRKERERELERQNERLEEFASVVSHDLRNPLSVAKGQLELARQTDDGGHIDSAVGALARMDALIDDLLTLARQGRMVEELEPVDLAAVADRAWATAASNPGGGELRVTDGELTVSADPNRLQQAFENLFANAVEHGGPGVTVAVGPLDGGGFYVADDGPGIPPEERDQVFERGYSTSEEGTGFGLSIVREIVDAHGWEISATESADGGARFEVTGVDRGGSVGAGRSSDGDREER